LILNFLAKRKSGKVIVKISAEELKKIRDNLLQTILSNGGVEINGNRCNGKILTVHSRRPQSPLVLI
jgi:hypothetical protein